MFANLGRAYDYWPFARCLYIVNRQCKHMFYWQDLPGAGTRFEKCARVILAQDSCSDALCKGNIHTEHNTMSTETLLHTQHKAYVYDPPRHIIQLCHAALYKVRIKTPPQSIYILVQRPPESPPAWPFGPWKPNYQKHAKPSILWIRVSSSWRGKTMQHRYDVL